MYIIIDKRNPIFFCMYETLEDTGTKGVISSFYIIEKYRFGLVFWFMVFNATFNNISVASWRSVLLVEGAGVPGENHRPVASHCQTLSHNVVSSTPRHERGSNSQV